MTITNSDKPPLLLSNGAYYIGEQYCASKRNRLDMSIDRLDYEGSYLCGIFVNYQIMADQPKIYTFFEGEILGPKFKITDHNYDVNELRIFSEWDKNNQRMWDSYDPITSDCIYMRLKEKFFLPDTKMKQMECARIDGHYFVCYDKINDAWSGFYHQKNSYDDNVHLVRLKRKKNRQSESYEFC